MAALSTAHSAALAALIDRCPERVLATLVRVVPQMGGDKATELAAMLEAETVARRRRGRTFAPLLPLFQPRADGVEHLGFPTGVLPRLWVAAIGGDRSLLPILDDNEGADADRVADRLCSTAAGAVRDRPDVIWPPELAPDARQTGLIELAACLDLAHLARGGVRQLPGWLNGQGEDQIAGLRLLLRDASAVAPDGAARMIEILFAHLADAPAILRIVTQTSRVAAREDFLGGSELADFVARIIRAMGRRVDRVAAFNPAGDGPAVGGVVEDVRWCAEALTQLDITLERNPQGEWSRDIRAARLAMAERIGVWIKAGERAMAEAAPRTRSRTGGRSTLREAEVDRAVEPGVVASATAWARLLAALRGPAAVFGAEADRRTRVEALVTELSDWADEAILAINGGEVANEAKALDRVTEVAGLLEALDAAEPARTVRRRVAVAGAGPGDAGASPGSL